MTSRGALVTSRGALGCGDLEGALVTSRELWVVVTSRRALGCGDLEGALGTGPHGGFMDWGPLGALRTGDLQRAMGCGDLKGALWTGNLKGL